MLPQKRLRRGETSAQPKVRYRQPGTWFWPLRFKDGDVGRQLGYALGGSGIAKFMIPAGKHHVGAKPRGTGQKQWLAIDVNAGETRTVTIPMP
jgi:hypothetical protein